MKAKLQALQSRLYQSRAAKGAIAFAGAASAGMANAAVDVSAVTDAITAAGVAIGLVGAAYIAMRVGGKVWKWIGSAI